MALVYNRNKAAANKKSFRCAKQLNKYFLFAVEL